MPKAIDLKGMRFERLLVIGKGSYKNSVGKVLWVCLCDCGKETVATTGGLNSGNTKSCGCLRVDKTRQNGLARKTHGLTRSPEYKAWQGLKDRCYNKDAFQYPGYGGRGIVVCERWLQSFENFLEDMGFRPGAGYSIDRKDNNGNYEPTNCRWVTAETQANNKRTNRYYKFDDGYHTLSQISRKLKVSPATLDARLRYGMSPEEAFTKKFHRKRVFVNGEEMSLIQFSKKFNVSYSKVYRHLVVLGKPVEDLLIDKES